MRLLTLEEQAMALLRRWIGAQGSDVAQLREDTAGLILLKAYAERDEVEPETDCGCHLCNGVTQHEQDMDYMCDTCKEEAEPPKAIEPLDIRREEMGEVEVLLYMKQREIIERLNAMGGE